MNQIALNKWRTAMIYLISWVPGKMEDFLPLSSFVKRENMADREVSWGDEPEEEVFVPTKEAEPVQEKKVVEKAPMPAAEWSIDTRGDLPTEKAVPSANSGLSSNSPAWPEEETGASASGWGEETLRTERPERSERNEGYSNGNYSVPSDDNGFDSRPPLTRRIGRDPVPSREPREPREFRGPREPREPRGTDSNGGAPRRSRNLDDLSTLNLPGVDLSKMPQATTRLSFPSREQREPREDRREPREDRRESRSYERNDVNRVTREVEEMGWGDEQAANTSSNAPVANTRMEFSGWGDEPAREPVREPVRETVRATAPSYTPARLEDNGWGDEPTEPVPEPVREPVRQAEPAIRVSEQPAKPVKVSNVTARLDDDGWGDEPEPARAEPVKIAEPVKAEPVRVSEPAKSEPIKSEPVKTAEAVQIREPAQASIVPSASAEQFVPAAQAQVPTAYPPMMMPVYPQMSPSATNSAAAPAPYMMAHHPMSPVGQMPMPVPMSCMPGMMMPIWVTCPFCYHCYMYPPVAPGTGPAPGAATLPSNQNQN